MKQKWTEKLLIMNHPSLDAITTWEIFETMFMLSVRQAIFKCLCIKLSEYFIESTKGCIEQKKEKKVMKSNNTNPVKIKQPTICS